MSKISALTALTGLAATDELVVVDKSDTTDAASGTTKRSTWLTLVTEMFASRFAADAGSNDTYAATLNPVPAAYVTGEHYRFKANTANTGAATINFNSLGAKTIKKAAGGITTDLDTNDIRVGQWVDLVYDGTNMQMQSLLGNAPAGGSGGFGDVVGPGSATDNAITRFDSTTGKLIQNSSMTCADDLSGEVGYINIPQNSKSAAYTTVLADRGKHIFHPAADTNARTFTIDSNANVAYAIGTAISFINMTSQVVTIAITSDTMYLAGAGTTGSRSLAQYGVATAIKIDTTTWIISGTGLT